MLSFHIVLKPITKNYQKHLCQNVLENYYSKTSFKVKNCNQSNMKVLNVAEKNDAAKSIAALLSRNNSRRREGISKYNKIYEFDAFVRTLNQNVTMVMTSVSGHLLTHEFTANHRKWNSCPAVALFDAPVIKLCPEKSLPIKQTLEREVRHCGALIIWTDCDREGENIGFEIIKVCQDIKPNIPVFRAKFSEITYASITRALNNLEQPNNDVNNAVDVRSELDLRIGAAFTRFQTQRLQRVFPRSLADLLISYGSCQFPTLGFIVERFLAIQKFQKEPYWKIKVLDDRDELCVEFRWGRVRFFEELPCQVILDICQENPQAKVDKIISKPKSKWRPLPLDTIELEKQGSRKLKITAKETMRIAEKLYTQGFISYPRTETNIFPKEMDLPNLVQLQTESNLWGPFAQQIIENGVNPRQGKKSDQAHPPIHPTKYTNNLQGDEAKVYEFVVRHFLACLSKDAQGHETIVDIDIAGEKFSTTGLQIIEKNYLEIYIYDKWNAKEIHIYEQGQIFEPTSIEMVREETSPPNLLTEADLIALMDKHGIGTDATHAEHIETIKSRHYAGTQDKYLMPGKLGIGLVMGYDKMGFQMSKPHLRAELESDLKLICEGRKDPQEVLQIQINKYKDVFIEATIKANLIDETLAEYLEEGPGQVEDLQYEPVEDTLIMKCPKCDLNMGLKTKKDSTSKYIGCIGFPACRNSIWFPDTVKDVTALDEICNKCPGNIRKLKVKLSPNVFPTFGTIYETCIGGCDDIFNQAMGIKMENIRKIPIRNNNQDHSLSNEFSSNRLNTNYSQRSTLPVSQNGPTVSSSSNFQTRDSNHRNTHNISNSTWNISNNFQSSSTQNNNNNGRGVNWTNNNSNDDEEIVCNCGSSALKLTVRKQGPNIGRQFYKCAKNVGQDCNFFLWATPLSNTAETNNSNTQQNQPNNYKNNSINSSRTSQGQNSSISNNDMKCNCNLQPKKLTVNKEGPNKGRQFWACPQGIGRSCNFFKWAAEDDMSNVRDNDDWGPPPPPASRGRGGRGSRGRNRGGGSNTNKFRNSENSGSSGGKRKCGNCGIPGHTRKTCPQLKF